MVKYGINFWENINVEKIEKVLEGLKVYLSGENVEFLIVDIFFCVIGCKLNLVGLNLENVGVEIFRGVVDVRSNCCII